MIGNCFYKGRIKAAYGPGLGGVQIVAVVLPILLTIAALGSQFSASVADTAGAGGPIVDLSNHRFPERWAYALILLVTVVLTSEYLGVMRQILNLQAPLIFLFAQFFGTELLKLLYPLANIRGTF